MMLAFLMTCDFWNCILREYLRYLEVNFEIVDTCHILIFTFRFMFEVVKVMGRKEICCKNISRIFFENC